MDKLYEEMLDELTKYKSLILGNLNKKKKKVKTKTIVLKHMIRREEDRI